MIAYCGAVPGTTLLGAAGRRAAAGTRPATLTTTLVFGWCAAARGHSPLPFCPLALWRLSQANIFIKSKNETTLGGAA